MAKNRIACCYFPTKVIFIDDGVAYLRSLRVGLDPSIYFQFYTVPTVALHTLQTTYKPIPFLAKWMMNLKAAGVRLHDDLAEEDAAHAYIDINLANIRQEIYSEDRFDEVSLIVIDYSMPDMSGLDFCRQLADSPIKKLMLTGLASQEIAVRAFNEGVIDQFLQKESREFYKELHQAIAQLQYRYFKDVSQAVIQSLSTDSNSCLSDPIFIDFFDKIRQENKIVEYYLVNESGSFLMLDAEGNPLWLLVKSERDMELNYDAAQGNDAPDVVQKSLKNREKLLFLLTKHDEWSVPVTEWENYMHLATKLIGEKNKYYCALVKGSSKYEIHPEKIKSYHQFLATR